MISHDIPVDFHAKTTAISNGNVGARDGQLIFHYVHRMIIRPHDVAGAGLHIHILMLACYANGRIGYVSDEHDVRRRTYAAYQSPKYCNQFPFTETSGFVMAEAISKLVNEVIHS